ncbi:MAG: S8 family serine peptidase [Sedimentisphaerales bacterium]|nr:S8 family serine peptidase [Sedimentisphaerales bacterium]
MHRHRHAILTSLFVLLSLCPPTTAAQERIVNIGPEQIRFEPRPDLGYVVKSSGEKPKTLLSRNSSLRIASEGAKYLNVAARPDMLVILDQQPSSQRESHIRILSDQVGIEYVAPLFSLSGETVAIIPEIIVRLRQETDHDKLEDLCRQTGCTILRNLLYTKLEFLLSPTARNAEQVLDAVETLAKANFVEWAYPNLALQLKPCGLSAKSDPNSPARVEPNDTYFHKQWHLKTIHAPEAWALKDKAGKNITGDPNIIVAVLDRGVDTNHPDLANNIWTNAKEIEGEPNNDDDGNGFEDDVHGWDFIDRDASVNPGSGSSLDAHGTECAGLIAAQGNNNLGVTGVTWKCTIMPVRIQPSPATMCETLIEPAEGLRYAAGQGADVISNSWATGYLNCPLIESAIEEVTSGGGTARNGKGCVVLFASGNWTPSGPVMYPARHRNVVAVGAIDRDEKAWYYSGGGPELDIVAPSGRLGDHLIPYDDVYTTDLVGAPGDSRYNHYSKLDNDYTDRAAGTSAACPIAAGVAALILSVDPNLTCTEVERILLRSARDLGTPGWDPNYGFGCVNAYAAVRMALSSAPPGILFVDDNATNDPGPGDPNISDPLADGSREHPYDAIQKGIDDAAPGETVTVLPGIYTGKGNRNIVLRGKPITVRSEGGPSTCIIDCEESGRGFYLDNEGADSVLEGFTITNGYAGPDGHGGGVFNWRASPTFTNCVFTDNSAGGSGGGMYNSDSRPTITDCNFSGNSAASGGGMHNDANSSPTVTSCLFSGNLVTTCGGGMYTSGVGGPTITDSNFTGNSAVSGGGMHNDGDSTATVTSCTFRANSATSSGGGMQNAGNTNSTVTDCDFTGNSAAYGGGMYNGGSGRPTVTDCNFTGNSATSGGGMSNGGNSSVKRCIFSENSATFGGGMYNNRSFQGCFVGDCIFSANVASADGGGMYDLAGSSIVNCTFSRNVAGARGGGLRISDGDPAWARNCTFVGNSATTGAGVSTSSWDGSTLRNCTLAGNLADRGRALANEGGKWISRPVNIVNCILWNGGKEIQNMWGGHLIITHCDVNDIWPGEGNISADPSFADPVKGDYHLKSQAGRWDPVCQTWVQDDVTSPCIDAGDPESPVGDEPEPNGGRINMGAYGGTAEASKSPAQSSGN